MKVSVFEVHLWCNRHEREEVQANYKEYGHDAFMLKLLLELVFEFEYDFVAG